MQSEPLSAHFDLLVQQNKQLKVNESWLIEQVSIMHDLLYPGRIDTWQGRTLKIVEKIKELTEKSGFSVPATNYGDITR